MWETGLEKPEGLKELSSHRQLMEVVTPCLFETKERTHRTLSQCSPTTLPSSRGIWKSDGAAMVSPQRGRLQRGAWWGSLLLCSSSASDQHRPHPHPAACVGAFEAALALLGSPAELMKGCPGIQSGSALLKNQTLISSRTQN